MAAIQPGEPATAQTPQTPRTRRPARVAAPLPYINRELSWLEFNARVLHEARDDRNPLLERVKFLSFWTELERDGFRSRLEFALNERATEQAAA